MVAQFGQIFGLIILIVSAVIGAILLLSPGSIRLQRPDCGWVGWAFNILNLLFFLILIPLCSVLILFEIHVPIFVCVTISSTTITFLSELIGLILFLSGSILLLWSRLSLRRSFRLGGVKPSQTDYLTMHGPYKYMRHPMYLSALLVLLGLTLILISILMAFMFLIMILLVIKLIPEEEIQLEQAYPMAYAEYCRRVPGALFPSR